MAKRRTRFVPKRKGMPGWAWLLIGVGGTLGALVLLVVLARGGVVGSGLRGEYVVESHGLWKAGIRDYEPWDLHVGSTVRFTASTFEGLGVNARYEALGDGRVQVGGAIWKAGWLPDGRLVILWTGEKFVLRRR